MSQVQMTHPEPHKEHVRVALVTGGSRGIGAEIASQLAQMGFAVIATHSGTTKAKYSTLKIEPGVICNIACDQTDSNQINSLFSNLKQLTTSIDALILNAGISVKAEFANQTPQQWFDLTRTLISGPIAILESAFLSLSRARKPALIYISSDVVDHPLPYLSTYGACKAGFEVYLNCQQQLLRQASIRTLILAPGAVDTDMQKGQNIAAQTRLNSNISPLSASTVAKLAADFAASHDEQPDWMRIQLCNLPKDPIP
jgi:short-subunit dehydrogenase